MDSWFVELLARLHIRARYFGPTNELPFEAMPVAENIWGLVDRAGLTAACPKLCLDFC